MEKQDGTDNTAIELTPMGDSASDGHNNRAVVSQSRSDKVVQTSLQEQSQSYENSKYWKKLIRPLLAEFIGTMFFHCAGIITSVEGNPVVGPLGVAMTLLGLCGAFFPLSGAQFNPAVSLAVFLSGMMAFDMMILYALAQLAGGTAAAAIAYGLVNSTAVVRNPDGWATNAYNAAYQNEVQAFFSEILLTCILVTVILSSMADCDGKNQFTWIFMVFTVAGNTFTGSYISGAGMNPSRSFGPALVFNYWGQLWIYTIGPLIGGCIAVIIYRFMTHHRKLRAPYLTFREEEGWEDD